MSDGSGSSMIWLVYLICQVWMARNEPASGLSNASANTSSAPRTAETVRATRMCGCGSLLAGGRVEDCSGSSGA